MQTAQASEYRLKQIEIFEQLEKEASAGRFGSFIPIASNFADDNRVSLAAIRFLPEALSRLVLQKLSQPLGSADPRQFFFAQESMHMTVQNVRKISERPTFNQADVEAACAVFRKVAGQFEPFDFSLEGLLVLPASVAIRAIAEPRFAQFSRAIRDGLKMSGVADDKPYINDDVVFGNITFCRFTAEPTHAFRQKIEELRHQSLGILRVDAFALMTTNAICDLTKTTVHEKFSLKSTE